MSVPSSVGSVGGFLISKFGKDIALAIMFGVSKFILFLMLSSFVATLLSFFSVMYGAYKEIIDIVSGLGDGSVLGTANQCISILLSAFAQNIGLIDALNNMMPTILLAYFTNFNVILLGYSIGIYRYIHSAIVEFALISK